MDNKKLAEGFCKAAELEGYQPGDLTLTKVTSVPIYNWNPLRWLFRRPSHYDVTYEWEARVPEEPQ